MNPFEIDLASLAMINDVPGVIMEHMTPSVENIPVFIMMAVNIILGFMLYTNVAGVQKRDGKDPYPLFLHCVLIVWDTLCTIMMWILAFRYDFFWLWTLFGILEPIWVWGEVKSIQAHIKTDREEELGRFVHGGNITEKQAWGYVAIMITVAAAFWLSISFILGGFFNASLCVTWPWTNFLFPWLCWEHWHSRAARTGTQLGNSMKVQLTIFIQITISWLPGTWFVLMMPFLQNPVFYLVGFASSALALANLLKVRKLPLPEPKVEANAEQA